jgi:hypothetical protein
LALATYDFMERYMLKLLCLHLGPGIFFHGGVLLFVAFLVINLPKMAPRTWKLSRRTRLVILHNLW